LGAIKGAEKFMAYSPFCMIIDAAHCLEAMVSSDSVQNELDSNGYEAALTRLLRAVCIC
jgi:hypothetical protein